MSSQDQTIEIDLEMPENYFSQCVQMEDLDAEDTVAAEINRTEVANERRNILPQKDKESLSTNINDTETGNIFSVGKRLESLNEVEEAKTSYEKATFCCPFEIYLALSADGKALKRNETANVDVIVDEKNNFKCLFYQEETDSTIQSAVDCFKNNNTHWDNTKVIRTDKDFNERDVLERSFPQASMQICLYHALRSFRREITMEKMGITSDERARLLRNKQSCQRRFIKIPQALVADRWTIEYCEELFINDNQDTQADTRDLAFLEVDIASDKPKIGNMKMPSKMLKRGRPKVFRSASGIDDASAPFQLFQSAGPALGDRLLKANQHAASELVDSLLLAMHSLAVIPVATCVLRTELLQLHQERDETFCAFTDRVRGKAETCAYTTECECVQTGLH
eukprot:gene1787-1990_t